MSLAAWNTLLTETRKLHEDSAPLQAFCPFPGDITTQDMTQKLDPLCDAMIADQRIATGVHDSFRAACMGAAPSGNWRETYKDTPIGDVLHAHFGCFQILGRDAVLRSEVMSSFLVYQKPGYHYPLHHHPAEEMYVILAGGGEFLIEGEEPHHLGPGDTVFHASNVPHALTTHDQPVLAYVVWRNHLDKKPVFTYPDQLA